MLRTLCAAVLALTPTWALSQQVATPPNSMTETYGAWTVRCMTPEAADSERQCEMVQELSREEDGQRLLAISVQDNEGIGQLVLLVPFGLQLSQGVQMTVAEGQVAQIPFHTCMPAGCIARTDLEAEPIARLQRGSTLQVEMRTTADEPFAVDLSLQGFTAAWTRLQDLADS